MNQLPSLYHCLQMHSALCPPLLQLPLLYHFHWQLSGILMPVVVDYSEHIVCLPMVQPQMFRCSNFANTHDCPNAWHPRDATKWHLCFLGRPRKTIHMKTLPFHEATSCDIPTNHMLQDRRTKCQHQRETLCLRINVGHVIGICSGKIALEQFVKTT